MVHFTETHRKTSSFGMYLLNIISTCHFCFIQKIIYHLKKNWSCFSLLKSCRSSIYVITIVKFRDSPIQNVFNFSQRTSMNFCKVSYTKQACTCLKSTIEPLEKEFRKRKSSKFFIVNFGHILTLTSKCLLVIASMTRPFSNKISPMT